MKATTEYDPEEKTYTILTPSAAFNPEVLVVDEQGALDTVIGLARLLNKHSTNRVTLQIVEHEFDVVRSDAIPTRPAKHLKEDALDLSRAAVILEDAGDFATAKPVKDLAMKYAAAGEQS